MTGVPIFMNMKEKTIMKNKLCMAGIWAVCFMLTGCCMNHEWKEASCEEPMSCAQCGKTQGEALGHTWVEATCAEPRTCERCMITEGEALGHTWVEATCERERHCSVCGDTDGEPLEHTLTEANFQQGAMCEVCGETVGEPLQAEFEKYGLVCNAELDTTYPYVIPCYDAGYTTNGKVIFSDYETFESDETHEALDGYEWKAVTCTIIFDDENAYYHGYSGFNRTTIDYYDNSFWDKYDEKTDTFTVNYSGIEYPGVQYDLEELQDGWVDDVFTYKFRNFYRVPKGYDGLVLGIFNPDIASSSSELSDIENFYEIAKENDDTILFRLK